MAEDWKEPTTEEMRKVPRRRWSDQVTGDQYDAYQEAERVRQHLDDLTAVHQASISAAREAVGDLEALIAAHPDRPAWKELVEAAWAMGMAGPGDHVARRRYDRAYRIYAVTHPAGPL